MEETAYLLPEYFPLNFRLYFQCYQQLNRIDFEQQFIFKAIQAIWKNCEKENFGSKKETNDLFSLNSKY